MNEQNIDFKQYIKDATTTESVKAELMYNKEAFVSMLKLAVATSNINDFMKKGIYYNRAIPAEHFNSNLDEIIAQAQKMKEIINSNALENKENIEFNSRVLHAGLGMFTEAGEIMEAILKAQSENMDLVNILEEIGDISWYEAIMLDELKGNLKTILDINIAKLKKRYPEKFADHHANNRDLEAEREILNKAVES